MDEVQNTLRLIHVSLNKTSDCRYVPLSSKHTDICWCWSYGKIILQLVSVWQIYQLIAINTPKQQAYLHNFRWFDLPECRRATSFLKTRKTRQLNGPRTDMTVWLLLTSSMMDKTTSKRMKKRNTVTNCGVDIFPDTRAQLN